MKRILQTSGMLVLRTDYSDTEVWQSICAVITRICEPITEFMNFVSDPEYDGITVEQAISLIPEREYHGHFFIVDRTTLLNTDFPILVVDLYPEPGTTFRVMLSLIDSIEANLSLANMDFEEFANGVDKDGVFRGF